MSKVTKYKNKSGKIVGTFNGTTFHKTVSEKKHLMRIYDAWGIDERILNELPPTTTIDIFDGERHYKTNVVVFRERGIRHEFGTHGKQVFLPRKLFNGDNPTLF